MKKGKFFLVMFLVGILIAGILFTCAKVKSNRINEQFQNVKYIEYRVKTGDTLWGISKEYNKFDISTQDYISKIFRMNNLHTEMIQDGSTLILVVPNN